MDLYAGIVVNNSALPVLTISFFFRYLGHFTALAVSSIAVVSGLFRLSFSLYGADNQLNDMAKHHGPNFSIPSQLNLEPNIIGLEMSAALHTLITR